ncbi:host-nuclease inhibitor Gam family protein [Geoalkalibacter sp.]|uniref:host-nuclease inhibitor Gam family protein n=1 Tax=Geoalkalibacter sp. TaxID=3041440 RepID=UPI00272E5AF5|nr:host-nuclease inhibitor Gam family protein [Geoalkalibacter sp.]
MTGLGLIEQRAHLLAERRNLLADHVRVMHEEIDDIKRRHMAAIKHAADDMSEAQALLHDAISAHPEMFVKPRTLVIAGIRCGYVKGKGEIAFDDEQAVIRLIRKHLPQQADQLIKTTERLLKTGLGQLSVAELRKIGCELREAGDEVVIKPTATDIDKLIDAILSEGERILAEVA